MARNVTTNLFLNKAGFFIAVALILLTTVFILWLSNIATKVNWFDYALGIQQTIHDYQDRDSREDAGVLATTIMTIPTQEPLIGRANDLEDYISTISHQTGRDIVVVDANEMILADTITSNVGKEYKQDPDQEVKKTLQDGYPRAFVETSIDYPNGISQNVISMRDSDKKIVGAVIMSTSTIFK